MRQDGHGHRDGGGTCPALERMWRCDRVCAWEDARGVPLMRVIERVSSKEQWQQKRREGGREIREEAAEETMECARALP